MSQPENEKVYSLGDYVAVCSETTDWLMCVISEINDPSKEVKVMFMKKSGQYFLLSKKSENWFPKLAIFQMLHTISSTDNCMRYSFDAIDIKSICDKIKYQMETSRCTFIFANHSSNERNKKEVVDIDKKFNCLKLHFSQTIDVSNEGQLL